MMKSSKIMVVLLAGTFAVGAWCPRAWGWQTNINGPLSLNDEARAATVDANGDVVAAGLINGQTAGAGADFIVVKLSGATGAELWRRVISGTAASPGGEARAVAVDAAGDVVAAGRINNTGSLQDFTVVKLSGATGAELWRQVINGTASLNDQARSVRVDAAGNVVAGGELQNAGTGLDFAVVKLSGATGAELWRQVINGTASGTDSAHGVRLDAAGNVVAGGELQNTGTGMDFAVVKLSGATGAELWRRQIDGSASLNDLAHTLRVDAAGNVVAAGELQNIGTGLDFTVVKLAGGTGAELWRQVLNGTASGTDSAHAVRVDAAGNVVAGGELQNVGTGMDFTVVKLSGATGAELWRQQINGSASADDIARAVRVDTAGDVLAAGELQNIGTGLDFAVLKLSGATGAEVWRRQINGTASATDRVHALTEDTAGDVVAGGFTTNIGTGWDFTVVKLRGTDGTDFVALTTTTTSTLPASTTTTTTLPSFADQLLPGLKLKMKSSSSSSSVLYLSRSVGLNAPACGGASDPTIVGASFTLKSATDAVTYGLPSTKWSVDTTCTVFKFANPSAPGGPSAVKVTVLKNGAVLKVVTKSLGTFSLDEASQGSVATTFASGSTRYCSKFGGTIAKDQPGLFIASSAPPPSACAAP